jgi:hypothetical protein
MITVDQVTRFTSCACHMQLFVAPEQQAQKQKQLRGRAVRTLTLTRGLVDWLLYRR